MSVMVYLYSKYSKACDQFASMLPINWEIRKICVDYEDFREMVKNDGQHLQIKRVPCLLLFFSNGGMRKYEGDEAFQYLQETIPPPQMNHDDDKQRAVPPKTITPIILQNLSPEVDVKKQEETPPDLLSRPDEEAQKMKIDKKKDNSLMSLAQLMEKQREEDDKQVQRPH